MRFLSIVLLLCAHAVSSFARPLEIGVTHFPPLYNIVPNKAPTGILTDILTATLDSMGREYHVAAYPPQRLVSNLISGTTDISLGIKTTTASGEESNVLYSSEPVDRIELNLYALVSTPLPTTENYLADLSNVGLIRGFQYGSRRRILLMQSENLGDISNINSHRSAVKMLLKGRISYLLDYEHPIGNILTARERELLHALSVQRMDLFFIVSKKTPHAEKLLEALEYHYSLVDEADVDRIDTR